MALRVTPPPPGGNHAHVVQVAVGKDHGLLLTDEGIVYSWSGKNDTGQLGRASATPDKTREPAPVEKLKALGKVIVQIACGKNHCLALSQAGELYSWGCNKAGQLGLGPKDNKAKSKGTDKGSKEIESSMRQPTPVHVPNSKDPQVIKSCSCGPESSACVTLSGDVYVWGAISHYLVSPQYADEENCTMPVKLQSMPMLKKKERLYCPDQVSVCREQIAITIAPKVIQDDLDDLRSLMKQRSSQIIAASVNLKSQHKDVTRKIGGDVFESNDSKALLTEFLEQKKALDGQVEDLSDKLKLLKEEIERIRREITVCEQKETALSDEKATLELNTTTNVANRELETRLKDIENFKQTTKKQKFELLEQRDEKERQSLALKQEYSDAMQQRTQADARSKLLSNLIEGKLAGKSASSSESVKVADSKLRELANTDPQKLAGVGQERFTGFREVLSISDRALQDVSRALREVSAAANEGDATVLEEVLESNLKLRKEVNVHIQEKLDAADGKGAELTGMNRFFYEAQASDSHGGLAPKGRGGMLQLTGGMSQLANVGQQSWV